MADALELAERPPYPPERRQHSRQQVRSIAYVELDEGNGGIVLNGSEGGLSVQAVVSLMDDQLPRLRIQLPQPTDWVEAGARIAWTGKSRKVVGLEFVDLPEQARNQIREWLSREALPAPPPQEAHTPRGETEQRAVAPVGGNTTVSLAEPQATAPAEKGRGEDVPPAANIAALPPAAQAEEPTPAVNSAIVSASAPASAPTPPASPVPISNRASRPVSASADRGIGRALDRTEFAELRLTSRPPKTVSGAPRRVPGHGVLATLIAVLAGVSLAAGWEAGRGAFDGVLARVRAATATRNVANRDVNSPANALISTASGTPVADVNVNNLRSAAPSGVPSPAAGQIPRRPAAANRAPQPPRTWVALQSTESAPSFHRQETRYASGRGDEVPPPVSAVPGSTENVLAAPGSNDFQASIPPPPAEQQSRTLNSAELIHRVDPVYPAIAREQRVQGTVILRVSVGEDGSVHDVELISGSPLLTRAAIDAVRQWRYRPTLLNGKPVPTNSEISLVFRLP